MSSSPMPRPTRPVERRAARSSQPVVVDAVRSRTCAIEVCSGRRGSATRRSRGSRCAAASLAATSNDALNPPITPDANAIGGHDRRRDLGRRRSRPPAGPDPITPLVADAAGDRGHLDDRAEQPDQGRDVVRPDVEHRSAAGTVEEGRVRVPALRAEVHDGRVGDERVARSPRHRGRRGPSGGRRRGTCPGRHRRGRPPPRRRRGSPPRPRASSPAASRSRRACRRRSPPATRRRARSAGSGSGRSRWSDRRAARRSARPGSRPSPRAPRRDRHRGPRMRRTRSSETGRAAAQVQVGDVAAADDPDARRPRRRHARDPRPSPLPVRYA